jgi:hypothetical protein
VFTDVHASAQSAPSAGLRNLPFSLFDTNVAWLEIIMAATDLVAWAKLIGFTDHPEPARFEIATFRCPCGASAHRSVTANRSVTVVPSTLRTCTRCGTEFHGRADAVYCVDAVYWPRCCRQRAYHHHLRDATPSRSTRASGGATGPVPHADTRMADRFDTGFGDGEYTTIAKITALIESNYRAAQARQRQIDQAEERAAAIIRLNQRRCRVVRLV